MPTPDVTKVSERQIAAWLFEFKLNGIIILENFLPVDLIDAMNDQFQEFLALEIEMKRKGTPLSGRGDERYAVNIGGLVSKLGGPLNDPRARANPVIEMLVERILGRWRHSNLIVETPCPGAGFMHWHGDLVRDDAERHRPRRTRQLKLQIPLVDVGETNGPFEFLPGSHRMHYTEGNEAVEGLAHRFSVRLHMKRGDCFLRDGDLIHRGTPNTSDAPRPLYTKAYKILDDAEE